MATDVPLSKVLVTTVVVVALFMGGLYVEAWWLTALMWAAAFGLPLWFWNRVYMGREGRKFQRTSDGPVYEQREQ